MINIPKNVEFIINTLEQNGYEAYIVGGCVRDSLLGKEPHDFDICTKALPSQTKECFKNYRIIETGMQHGTITVIIDNEPYEITTYRLDGEYLDNRHPSDVKFVTSLKEDLARRDFTINAMAYNKKTGLVDFFNGQDDLQNKKIKCVGDSAKRFNEDALRIMRALRFASVYGFTIHEDTKKSIHSYKYLLRNIAEERINVELCKLLCGDGVEDILLNYHDVLGVFIPEISPLIGLKQNNPYHIYDVWKHIVKAVVNSPKDITIRLTMLFHDIGKQKCYSEDENGIGHFYVHELYSCEMAIDIMKRLKFDNNTINQVKELILYHDAEIEAINKHIKRWLNKIGEERLRQLLLVKKADTLAKSDLYKEERLENLIKISECIDYVIANGHCFTTKDLAINGRDLIDIGVIQGVIIGNILNNLTKMVIDEEIQNEKTVLLEKSKELIKEL